MMPPIMRDDQDADQGLGDNPTAAENETDASLTLSGADKKYFEILRTPAR